MNIKAVEKCAELEEEAMNLWLDWKIKSWSLKDEDREIAKLYSQKAFKQMKKYTRRLEELTNI